ncbi:MAG: acetyltransferase [Candidatus Thermoplasmatota archaeon]|nr:acetyltransferase [Candidatus Thermoplasmatota archaeon]MBU1941370.1 acetyltransferase [Candidatus Thermoplasmatota archaeon]
MPRNQQHKQKLDQKRTEWRKTHRTLNGRIILYSDKPAEHINARGSKVFNWFWKKILLTSEPQHIPAIISGLKNNLKNEKDSTKIRVFRTMIGMAEDAYQFKNLENILEYDNELQLETKPIYNADDGVLYRDGKVFTIDFNEDETAILIRDIEGIIIDALTADETDKEYDSKMHRNAVYKDWKYMD